MEKVFLQKSVKNILSLQMKSLILIDNEEVWFGLKRTSYIIEEYLTYLKHIQLL